MGAPRDSVGDVSAEELFRQHAPFVARFLFRLGVHPDAIEDAVQEVFLVVHRQGGYRAGPARPTSYLANLAVHAASAHRRRERVRGAREVDAHVDEVPSTRSDPVSVLEANESLRRLQAALDRLDPDLRTVLVLVEIEGETSASIAAAMGIPAGTVYWRLHQARKKFERALQATEATVRPHPAMAVQAAGLASGRHERKERAGMVIVLMTSPSWLNSEARDSLRLGAARPPVSYALQDGLARHRQLAASGAPAPSWASRVGAAAKTATWVATATAVVAVGATALILAKPALVARSAPAAHAVVATSRANQASPAAATANLAPATAAAPWVPLAAPEPLPSGLSVPVEALPAVTPPSAAARAARGVDARGVDARSALPTAASGTAAPATSTLQATGAPASVPTDEDLLELGQVARAEQLLAADPAGARALVLASDKQFPRGYLKEERGYVEIMALIALGRLDEARAKAGPFLRDYPESAYGRRVREASRRAHIEP